MSNWNLGPEQQGQPQQGQSPQQGQQPPGQPSYGQQHPGQQHPGQPPHDPSYGQPGPGYGQQPYPVSQGEKQAPPYGYVYEYGVDPRVKPGPVKATLIMAYVGSGLALVGLLVIFAAAGSQSFIEGFLQGAGGNADQADADAVATLLRVVSGIGVVLAAIAIVLAVFLGKRKAWARIALYVSSALGALLAVFFAPLGLVWTGLCIACVVCLAQSSTGRWLRAQG